jgi:hypothetical protein
MTVFLISPSELRARKRGGRCVIFEIRDNVIPAGGPGPGAFDNKACPIGGNVSMVWVMADEDYNGGAECSKKEP